MKPAIHVPSGRILRAAISRPIPAIAGDLMKEVLDRENLNAAYYRVKENAGAPGLDGMTVANLHGWLRTHGAT